MQSVLLAVSAARRSNCAVVGMWGVTWLPTNSAASVCIVCVAAICSNTGTVQSALGCAWLVCVWARCVYGIDSWVWYADQVFFNSVCSPAAGLSCGAVVGVVCTNCRV
jgi:hypothetical protein